MNTTKQDAMDDKIIERCKTCDNRSRSCRAAIERKPRNLDGSRICRESNRQTECSENFLDGLRSCQGSVEITRRRLDKKNIC